MRRQARTIYSKTDDALRATARHASRINPPVQFIYVYILQSESAPQHFYTGITENLRARLDKHNAGGVPHTAKHRPWRTKTAIAFTDRDRAIAFERYLKSASGRAFAKKRF